MSKVDYLVYVENWLCEQDMYRVCGSYPNCIRKKRDNQKIKSTDELLDESLPRHCSLNGGQTKVCRLIKSREVPQEIIELRERLDMEHTNLNMHHENEKYLTIKKQIENNRWIYEAIENTKKQITLIKEKLGRYDIEPLRFHCDDKKIIDMF